MRVAVADVETTLLLDGTIPRTKFWGLAVEGGGYLRFETSRAVWEHLDGGEPLCVYTHHDFDLLQLMADGMPLRLGEVRGGRILRAYGPEGIEWRNSHALFPSSLAEILSSCGFVKPELEDLEERNRADCEDALVAFRMIADAYHSAFGVEVLGARPLTAASAAFRAAVEVAGPLPVHLQNRDAYRGGRTEAFRLWDCGTADAWDIASSYPAAFAQAPARDTLYYLDVEVDCGDSPAPLPWITDSREKLLFPQGRFRTAVWQSSYERYVKPWGAVKELEVLDAIPCDLSWLRDVGAGLVRGAYDRRREAKRAGRGAEAYALKIALNSVYGRLGLKPKREAVFLQDRVASGGEVTYYALPNGRYLSFREVTNWRIKANYLFASWVTCNARGRLYDALMRADANGGAYYCDTDSVYCAPGALDGALAEGDDLGGWQREGTERLWIESVKDYTFGSAVKRKGGDGHYQWTLKRLLAGRTVLEVRKQRRTDYNKREVYPDGSTRALELCEW